MVKNPPANAGDIRDVGSIPESGRFPGEGNSNPLQYSCLGNPMARGACWAIAKESDTTEQKQLLPLPAVLGRIIHSSELWPFFLSSTCFIKALKAESTFSKWLLDYYCYHYPQTTPFTRTCRTSEVHAGY